jgi:hypothetical protein
MVYVKAIKDRLLSEKSPSCLTYPAPPCDQVLPEPSKATPEAKMKISNGISLPAYTC